jgi:tol-pal system protein YbgF
MRTRLPGHAPLLSALLLAAPGCFYPSDRGRLLEQNVDRLRAENEALRKELAEARSLVDAQLPRLDEKVAQVNKATEELKKAARQSGADVALDLQKTQEEVVALNGRLEAVEFQVRAQEAALKAAQAEHQGQLEALKGEQARAEAEAKRRAEELSRPADKRQFLQLAQDKLKAKELPAARQLLTEWLKKWPRDELAAEAHQALGVSYAEDGKCREALYEFSKVIQDHPKSGAAPDALLRSSTCFTEVGMADESRLALEELVASYPNSAAAKQAKVRLDALKKKGKGKK